MTTSFKRVSARNLEFAKLRQRGSYHFCPVNYKGAPLTIETPALITPTGINADEARYWMDVELDVANNAEHQTLYDMFKSVDDRCIDECIANLKSWFNGKPNVDEVFIEDHFKSPLTAGWQNEPALLRVEIVSEQPEDLTDAEGNVISPNDVTALSSVTIKMQLLGVWASERFLGCHWRALSISANLDHERKGQRRSSSPRPISPPPPIVSRSRTAPSTLVAPAASSAAAKSGGSRSTSKRSTAAKKLELEEPQKETKASATETLKTPDRADRADMAKQTEKADEANGDEKDNTAAAMEAARKARVQQMLQRFRNAQLSSSQPSDGDEPNNVSDDERLRTDEDGSYTDDQLSEDDRSDRDRRRSGSYDSRDSRDDRRRDFYDDRRRDSYDDRRRDSYDDRRRDSYDSRDHSGGSRHARDDRDSRYHQHSRHSD